MDVKQLIARFGFKQTKKLQTLLDEYVVLSSSEPVAWLDFHSRAEPNLQVGFDEPVLRKGFADDVVWKEPLYKANPINQALLDSHKRLQEALWVAHEHAKLDFGAQYHKGQNVFDGCEQALAAIHESVKQLKE